MHAKKLLTLAAALSIPMMAAQAHFPPAPNPNCNDGTDGNGGTIPHDFVGATSATVTTGITGEFGGGITIVFDGSLNCPTEDFCPSGEDFLTIDPSGDDLPDGTDPSGDNVVISCDDILVGGTQVPGGDGEYEFGLSGAFLPDTHHDPLTNGFYVDADLTDGGFIFGNDSDNDGDVEDGSGDCFQSHASEGNYQTNCTAGADGGWWLFTKCNATTLSDWTFTTNGALIRLGLGDNDGDDIPNSLEDDDSDGVPNGLDSDNPSDDFVNANWNPTPGVGTIPPDAAADCLGLGHVGDCGFASFCPVFEPQCRDGVDNDLDGVSDYPDDPGCTHPNDDDELDPLPPAPLPECANGGDDDADGAADWPNDPQCESPADEGEAPACSNGLDDDSDGVWDFPGDPDCSSSEDDSEDS
ncbi:MAG TPA: hypothetical protein VHH36_07265 [Candidatus Thermoplasmatota archaeon]|nr:hypothetical protein [Candidatus Thermoplasmatota archaeon]